MPFIIYQYNIVLMDFCKMSGYWFYLNLFIIYNIEIKMFLDIA